MNFGIEQLPLNNLTMVDLFCGAGIGAYGFKKAGFNIVYALDNVQYAVDTYNHNIGNHAQCVNIKKIDLNVLPDADIYVGGFPCTPFSLGGAGNGEKDKFKGDLGEYFLNAIKVKKPKAFIIENVKGIVSNRHLPFFKKLLKEFENTGYNISWKLSDCYEYGVPQIRERVFVIGIRSDLNKVYEFPIVTPESERLHLHDAIGDLPEPSSDHGVKNHKYHYVGGYSPRYISRNRQRQWGEASFTICSSARQLPLHPSPENYDIRVEDIVKNPPPRRFTVRECLRIQTVPDDFHFDDSIDYMKQHVRCSGIPSLVAYKLSIKLAELLK